jgi:hypothetical protein
LLIREADADDVTGTDEKALVVGCNMAQAFENPKGVTVEHIEAASRPAQT